MSNCSNCSLRKLLGLAFMVSFCLMAVAAGSDNTAADRRFGSIVDFTRWTRELTENQETVFTSPVLEPGMSWNEFVLSWNGPGTYRFEAKAVYSDRETKWYGLGNWSNDPTQTPRESVPGQKDADGDVLTDTLVITTPAPRLRLRISVIGGVIPPPFLGLSFLNSTVSPKQQSPQKRAWGKYLDVPERSQLTYLPAGKGWCSPACTSMVLGYWSRKLAKPELDRDVPSTAVGVDDPKWPGTGNWPFNTAYAGLLPGIRGYVSRLGGLRDLEEWVRSGVPLACSVSYELLYDVRSVSSGHFVVCRGFTKQGDVIVNDPWADFAKGDTVRQVIPRKRFAAAWAKSHHTAYLIYPLGWKIAKNRDRRWADR